MSAWPEKKKIDGMIANQLKNREWNLCHTDCIKAAIEMLEGLKKKTSNNYCGVNANFINSLINDVIKEIRGKM